jgi:pimeloyl-ACP methyl ester carboxylesterase
MGGRVLVMLHGQPGSGSDWREVTARLPADVEAVVVDRPGYGANPGTPGGFGHNAAALVSELDSRGIDRAVLVGHSWGAGVALATAKLAPERVEALVLVASIGPGCVSFWDRVLAAPIIGPVCSVVAWSLTPWIARVRLSRIERLRDRPLGPDEHVNWRLWSRVRHDHGAVWRSFLVEQRALLTELDELVDGLPSLDLPVLLLHDPADSLVPYRCAEQLAELLPSATLVQLTGGHQLPQRVPGLVAGALVRFLDELPDGEPSQGAVG